jgi:N-acetylglucosamine kinase-like BadF-type ATPase
MTKPAISPRGSQDSAIRAVRDVGAVREPPLHGTRPALFAGIDGGASKTIAVVVDADGRERGRGTAPSSNQTAVGLERAAAAVRQAIAEATRAAGEPGPVAAARIGLAGVDRPGDFDAWLPLLRPLAGTVHLSNDAELVLAALPDGVGVAAIAGTGSIMVGRDDNGTNARTGGWGHVFGDEGSGYDLGRGALQAASRAADGRGPATVLLDAILRHWDLSGPSDIIGRVYPDGAKADVARLSSLVLQAARAGDPVARKLVSGAAAEVALGIVTVANALTLPADGLPLALAGGLLVGAPELRAATLRRVRRRRPLGMVVVVDEPAAFAARAAIRLRDP